jgi:hypothetical protein
MRRRKLLVVLAGLAVVVAVGAVVLWPRGEPDRITQANFDRIHEGMTRAEVETLLGPPNLTWAGLNNLQEEDFEPIPAIQPWGQETHLSPDEENFCFRLGNAGAMAVAFEDDRAVWKAWRPHAGPLTRLRRQWHRWITRLRR